MYIIINSSSHDSEILKGCGFGVTRRTLSLCQRTKVTGFRASALGHFQVGSHRYRSLIKGVYSSAYRSLIAGLLP